MYLKYGSRSGNSATTMSAECESTTASAAKILIPVS